MESYLIDPAYVALYLGIGVAMYLVCCWQTIKAGDTRPEPFSFMVLVVALGPTLLFLHVLIGIAKATWDATTAWKRFGRLDSGTEELIVGGLWIWLAIPVVMDVELGTGRWWFVALMAVTVLFLWQSAKAMQRLNQKTAKKDSVGIYEGPPPEVMDRCNELRREMAKVSRNQRYWDHVCARVAISKQAERIKEETQEAWNRAIARQRASHALAMSPPLPHGWQKRVVTSAPH